MSRPVIGLTCYLEPARWGAWELPAALLPHWYVDAIQAAGGRVVLVPPDEDGDVDVLDRLDALVIVGGADVDARHYRQSSHETADEPRVARDSSELQLYRGARERDLPVLGICRGLQIMAVAHGGSLHQHLPDVSELVHRVVPGAFVEHEARFEPGSLIATVMGTTDTIVNSSHHQAVADPGSLQVTGTAADGTIEACEDDDRAFVLGVQWHPEHPDRRTADAGIFGALIDAATRYRSTH
ncbi:MAG: gamma-glutamyl-gamma-aminobutyrate hydrolase family protein [Actinomycetales bacterium]|nr:gamma-glutamyl-gamma-aminobutyrate hydrolase family protein [Actinomycetales bacterium]